MRGSVATLEGGRLLGQVDLPQDQRSAQSLTPGIAAALAAVGWKPADVELVAVTQGPGSFTGLRVGVTAAKTLAYAVGAQVLGVDTLEVLACQAPPRSGFVCPVIDAQRQQLFAAQFHRAEGGELKSVRATQIIDNDGWLAELAPGTLVIGPGLAKLAEKLPPGVTAAPLESWTPQAATVGRLAYRQYLAGRRDDVWKLAPNYFRTSAAEEKQARGAGRA